MAVPGNPTLLEDVLRNFLDTACECLEGTTAGAPANCFLYPSEPPDDCCDLLAVYPRFIRHVRGFSENQIMSGVALADSCGDVITVVDIGIRLVRPCWPTATDNAANPFPTAEEMDAATALLYEDSTVLRCCLFSAYEGGFSIPGVGSCLEVAWGDMLPHGPQGGCAGWTWYLTVELPQCCF